MLCPAEYFEVKEEEVSQPSNEGENQQYRFYNKLEWEENEEAQGRGDKSKGEIISQNSVQLSSLETKAYPGWGCIALPPDEGTAKNGKPLGGKNKSEQKTSFGGEAKKLLKMGGGGG